MLGTSSAVAVVNGSEMLRDSKLQRFGSFQGLVLQGFAVRFQVTSRGGPSTAVAVFREASMA